MNTDELMSFFLVLPGSFHQAKHWIIVEMQDDIFLIDYIDLTELQVVCWGKGGDITVSSGLVALLHPIQMGST